MDVKRRRFALYITFLWRIFVCPTNSTVMNTYLQCSKPSFILHKKLTHYRENSMFTEFLKLLRIGRTYTAVNILILECIKPQMGWYWFDMMAFICADVPLNICVCHRLSLLILCQVICYKYFLLMYKAPISTQYAMFNRIILYIQFGRLLLP